MKTNKIRVYTTDGREKFLNAGAIVPAGWHDSAGKPIAREMRVEEAIDEGCPYDQTPTVRRWLVLVPNITAAHAAAEAAALAAADEAALTAALGGMAWRIDARELANQVESNQVRWQKLYDEARRSSDWKAHCQQNGWAESYNYGDITC